MQKIIKKQRFAPIALIILLLVTMFLSGGCSSSSATAADSASTDFEPYTITDMGGREVTIEAPIEKAYASNLIGILYIETMDISKLGGWTNELSDSEKAYIPDEYEDLPMLGGWSSANPTANIEELVNADIDVILVTAIVSQKVIDMADNIQSQTGIPTVIVSSDLNSLGDAYTLLGTLFEEPDRGQELSDYCLESLAETKAMIDQVPDDEKVTVFYSEGTNGMETDPSGSMHTQAFDFVGAVNVADISENTTNGLVGQSEVSMEQIITWNPQFIIRNSTYTEADPTAAVDEIMNNPDWANIQAVKDGNVYQTPALPNNWIDRAPSVNRVLGVKWLADLFYPNYVDYDIHEEAKEFFSLFYNLNLSDEDLTTILGE
ncbi:ABC transporter substrate-binding protein [Eubacteriaceae bacterium ES2]|nr:ABC transporter substrate-binding protein [Eubacteriaceae bacterium ES2]